jgi:Chitobiase/beta-hexosaminidase C-terminal domain
LLSTAANDFVFAKIRYTVDGSTPTTGSTVLGTVQAPTGASQSIVPMTLKYIPGSDLTFTPLLTVGRSAGSGNCSLAVGASVSPEIDLMVIAAGLAPADTGTDI